MTYSIRVSKSKNQKYSKSKTSIKYGSSSLALLSLAACGGGDGAGSSPAPTNNNPTPAPTPAPSTPQAGFDEISTNVFLAKDNQDSTFNRSSSSTDIAVSGRNGNDNITTGSGDDELYGQGGVDRLNGGAGLDFIEGGAGADILNGGDGLDWLSYRDSNSAVNINLTAGTASGGHAQGDTFSNFELVLGSNFNDTITGKSGVNFLEGAGGADTINGVGDLNFVTFYSSPSAVTINLGTNSHSGGHANGDSYTNIYGVFGSIYNDNLTGDADDNELWGNTGNDILNGGDGNDILDGAEGNDTINGQGGNDVLFASAGSDIFDGGDGEDSLSFFYSTSGININLGTGTSSNGYASGITFTNIERVIGSNFGDNITGDSNDNYLSGLDGVDNLDGGAGNDYLKAFEFEGSAEEDAFDGGDGYDKFDFEADSTTIAYNLDLASVNLTNIEMVRMGHDYKESLTLTAQDVIDVTDVDNILNVIVHDEDSVTSGSTWTYVEDVMSVGQIYHQYTSGAATVNIYIEAGSQTGFAKPADSFTETSANVFDAVDNNNSSISKEHVSDDLTINGKDGNDLMAGGAGDDVINGGNGNDSMRGNSGINTLNGDAGDDLLIYSNSDSSYDGGADTDTLQLVSQSDEIDLSTLTLTNIEVFDLSSIYSNSTTLTAQDVLDVTDGGNLLIIAGDANDSVNSTGQGWVAGGTQNVDGQDYDVYTSGASTLYIDEDIIQTIS